MDNHSGYKLPDVFWSSFSSWSMLDWFAIFQDNVGFLNPGKMVSQISAEPLIAIGMIGQFAFAAILKLPSWNGSMSSSSSFLFRVPSGKMQMEIPDFTFSIAVRMVLVPASGHYGQETGSEDVSSR